MDNEIRFGNAPECPKGFTPNHKMDAANEEKRYYRKQWLAEKDRAEALAAHVEALEEAGENVALEACSVSQASMEWSRVLNSAPKNSIARRDLTKQAEALESLVNISETYLIPVLGRGESVVVLDDINDKAAELRRQAGGGES